MIDISSTRCKLAIMTECRHLLQPDVSKALVEAVWIGHVDCVKKLLEEGADVNTDNTAGNNVLITLLNATMNAVKSSQLGKHGFELLQTKLDYVIILRKSCFDTDFAS